jgi:Cft2 family RNA processing exonuclease
MVSELPTVKLSPTQKMLKEHGAVISCDRFSSKTRDNGKPKWQPILIGNSIVCDGWESGKTTAVFSHFHEDHTWNFSRTLSNCHKILLTETTYQALRAIKKIPERANIERLPYGREHHTSFNETIELINANHVPGSSQILVTMDETGKKILYSGDFSFPELQTPKADVLVLDGTHGTEEWDFDTDKPSVLRRIFDEVIKQIRTDKPAVEIIANRGTMQDIMAELEKEYDGNRIPEDVPFLADEDEISLTNAIKHEYGETKIREIELSSENRLDELYNFEKKPYVRFTTPQKMNTSQNERGIVIQADVNPNFKTKGPLWYDKNGKAYACLAAHAGYSEILEYVSKVDPKEVIVDGTRINSETALSLSNSISKKLGINSYMYDC